MGTTTQAAAPTEARQAKEEPVVEYVGTADVREITKAQWKGAGVEDQDKVVWDRRNRFKVKASELNADALEVLRGDPGFKLPQA